MLKELKEIEARLYLDTSINSIYLDNFYFNYSNNISEILTNYKNSISLNKNKKFNFIISQSSIVFKKSKIDYTYFSHIKNDNETLIAFISLFIIKSFSELRPLYNLENNQLNGHSDELINNTIMYIKKLIAWIEIHENTKFNITTKEFRYIITSSFISLSHDKKINNFKINKNKKTYIYYTQEKYIPDTFNYFISEIPYKAHPINNKAIYLYSNHFSSIQEIYRENISTGVSIDFRDNESYLIDKIASNWIYIDKFFLGETITVLLKEINLNKESIIKKYHNNIQIIKNLLSKNDIKTAAEVSKEVSTQLTIINLICILNNKFIEEKRKIYLPFMFDFRGRLYYTSVLSPTFNKYIRNCMHWGAYNKLEPENHIFNDIINAQLDPLIDKIKHCNRINENGLNIHIKRSLLWLYVAAAETKKTQIGPIITLDVFIEEGVKILNNFKDESEKYADIDIFLKIKYIVYIIDEISKKIFIKRCISKDATASVYQHLIKSLGWKNEDALKWCNLNSKDTWYDVYSYIINTFKKNIIIHKLNENEFKQIFNRTSLKKTIMTVNYGASFKTCWNNFSSHIQDDHKNNIEKYDEIKNIFKLFYGYICKEEGLVMNNSKEIYNSIKLFNFLIEVNSGLINLSYQKIKTHQIEIYVDNKRYTKKELILLNELDDKQIKKAIRANYIHSLDAALVRWFLLQTYGFTIHDCFLIDYLNITYLLSKINEGMRITFHDLGLEKPNINNNLFSIFILL